jgi:hypothetical protein
MTEYLIRGMPHRESDEVAGVFSEKSPSAVLLCLSWSSAIIGRRAPASFDQSDRQRIAVDEDGAVRTVLRRDYQHRAAKRSP